MIRRTLLPALIASLLLALGCGRPPTPVEVPPEPWVDPATLPRKYRDHNLVLVSFDALQAAHVHALGYPRPVTPTLDALARRGFNFTRAYSVASWTVPASMTWFTGVYPCQHRMTNKYAIYQPPVQKMARLSEQAPDLTTLAEVLRANGYATAGFTGNAGVSGGFGYEQGFDVYVHDQARFGQLDESIPRALAWLRDQRERKFFLFLHGYDVHGQAMPNQFDYRFVDKQYDRRYLGTSQEQAALREEGLDRGQLTLREADVRFWRAIYDEKLQRADEKFGQFLQAFEQLGLAEKTLFVVTSDHGTELYEHRRFDHGFTLYNEQIHVPLMIQLPGQRFGRDLAGHVSSIDVMPTLLDLLDIPLTDRVRGQLRGVSLASAFSGQAASRDVFSETDYRQYTYKRSILTADGWKLIVTLENQTRELYDLNTDSEEKLNLLAQEPARAAELEQRLLAHFRALGHDWTKQRWLPGFNPVYSFPGK